jgi:hypothetical protein
MAGLDPAIHGAMEGWMAGSEAGHDIEFVGKTVSQTVNSPWYR